MSNSPDRMLDSPFAKVGQVLAVSLAVGGAIYAWESIRANQNQANIIESTDPDGKIRAYQGLMINLRGNPRFAESHLVENLRQGRGIINTEDGTRYFALPSPTYESTRGFPQNRISQEISWDRELTVIEKDERRVYGIQIFYLNAGDPKLALIRLRLLESTTENPDGTLTTVHHEIRLS